MMMMMVIRIRLATIRITVPQLMVVMIRVVL